MKETLDRQLTGQSSTPFMKATSNNDCHSSQNQQKKGVTFDAMETLERNSDCIDRLTTLVSDLKMTMDRKQLQYKPKIYQGRPQNQNAGRQNLAPRNRSFSRGRNQGGNRGNYNNRNNYRQIIEIDQEADGTTTGQVIGMVIIQITTDEVIQDCTIDKTHNGPLETEVKVEAEMKTMVMIIFEVEVEIEIKGDEENPGLDLIQG